MFDLFIDMFCKICVLGLYKIKLLIMRKEVLLIIGLFHLVLVKADIELPAIIGDHMVLKQNSTVALWGTESPGTKLAITVSWDNETYETMVGKDGKWLTWVNTPSAGGPYTIHFKGNSQVTINDVLIGEVWLSSGQSNMQRVMSKDTQAETMLPQASNSNIRLFKVGRQKSEVEVDYFAEGTIWEICSPESAADFSAMSYYFALDLHDQLNVPVGIINASWSGTPIESWISTMATISDSLLEKAVKRWDAWEKNYAQDKADYTRELTKFRQKEIKERPRKPQSVLMIERDFKKYGVLYNGMIAPCTPYTLSGVLWYQGSANVGRAEEYEHQLTSLIHTWRSAFNNKDLPVIIGQLTVYKSYDLSKGFMLRMAQLNQNKIPNAYVFCTMDIGLLDDLHPPHKQPYGERFSALALNKIYGRKDIPCMCPQMKEVKIENSTLEISFYDGEGLYIKGEKLEDIFIAGEDGKFFPADVKIRENKLIVSHPDISKPKIVRYLFNNTDKANLFNAAGLPAFPFVGEG